MIESANILSWPPPYTLRKHRRARYVRFRTTKQRGLEITIPYRFNLKELPAIIEQHKDWITKQLLLVQNVDTELPKQVTLATIEKTLAIQYLICNSKLELIERPYGELVLVGREDHEIYKDKLRDWLKNQAKFHLFHLLSRVSQEINLSFSDVNIRDQRTIWGSCTSKKLINLNYKLLFLPYHLTRHILVHELCHTKQLNHSPEFWQLVASHDPNWQEHKRELRKADKFIPGWV